MKKEEQEEGGDTTDNIGTNIGGNRRDGVARRGVKKDEDDIEDDRQNCILTATVPSSSKPTPWVMSSKYPN